MTCKGFSLAVLMMFGIVITGCARVQEVTAVEGDTSVPYDSLGTLQVEKKVPYVRSSGLWWGTVEVVSLGLAGTPSRGEQLKKSLRSKLAETARKQCKADLVIKVEYWPDPESSKFPDGRVYARGEMIKLRRFAAQTDGE